MPSKHSYAAYNIAFFSLLFLFIGNIFGLLLSVLIIWPDLNNLSEGITYGRLVPVHLNTQLYGWCALPLLGLLYAIFLRDVDWKVKSSSLPIYSWTCSLLIGAISWIMGSTTGKIFLEWKGIPKYLFITNLVYLLLFLGIKFSKNRAHDSRLILSFKIILLSLLTFIPFIFLKALSIETFPPINTISSGATGTSLLLSTLVVVFIMILSPRVLKIGNLNKNSSNILFSVLAAHFVLGLCTNVANSSNLDLDQIFGLSSLIIWIPLVYWYYRNIHLNPLQKKWIYAVYFYGLILVLSATSMFLAPILSEIKFTSFLVAHVHLAMGGVLSSYLIFILMNLDFLKHFQHIFSRVRIFWTYNLGLVLHLLSLMLIGSLELKASGFNYGVPWNFPYYLRLVGGILMLYASGDMLLSLNNLSNKQISEHDEC